MAATGYDVAGDGAEDKTLGLFGAWHRMDVAAVVKKDGRSSQGNSSSGSLAVDSAAVCAALFEGIDCSLRLNTPFSHPAIVKGVARHMSDSRFYEAKWRLT
jgi:hypothetical protein